MQSALHADTEGVGTEGVDTEGANTEEFMPANPFLDGDTQQESLPANPFLDGDVQEESLPVNPFLDGDDKESDRSADILVAATSVSTAKPSLGSLGAQTTSEVLKVREAIVTKPGDGSRSDDSAYAFVAEVYAAPCAL